MDGGLDPSVGPVAAVRADPLDGRGGSVGFVADLVLDLVDDALDVARQIGLAGQLVTPVQAAMVRRTRPTLRPWPRAWNQPTSVEQLRADFWPNSEEGRVRGEDRASGLRYGGRRRRCRRALGGRIERPTLAAARPSHFPRQSVRSPRSCLLRRCGPLRTAFRGPATSSAASESSLEDADPALVRAFRSTAQSAHSTQLPDTSPGTPDRLRSDRHDRADIWFVKDDGSNLDEVVGDTAGT